MGDGQARGGEGRVPCCFRFAEFSLLAIVTASLRTNRPEDLGRHKGLKGENPSRLNFERKNVVFDQVVFLLLVNLSFKNLGEKILKNPFRM